MSRTPRTLERGNFEGCGTFAFHEEIEKEDEEEAKLNGRPQRKKISDSETKSKTRRTKRERPCRAT